MEAEGGFVQTDLYGEEPSSVFSIGLRPLARSLESRSEPAAAASYAGAGHDAAEEAGVHYRRHDLVRVDPAAWTAALGARPDLDGLAHLEGWGDACRPLIVRRFLPGEARGLVPLGLPLPPAHGKRRVGFALPTTALTPCEAPTLDDTRAIGPPGWRRTLDALTDLGLRFGLVPRPFGSLLWQAVTGLTYLTDTSDIDVLWRLPGATVTPGFLEALDGIAAVIPMQVDGELLLPDGGGVQWRELLQAPADGVVLVKHHDRLELRPVAELRATHPA